MQTVWHAIVDAGYIPTELSRRTGVFVGVISSDYGTFLENQALRDGIPMRRTDRYQIANRISYHFDFTGPSMVLDTACSSSDVALHQARIALDTGDCDLAIVGGVNLFLHASRFAQYRKAGILSEHNICRPFREGSNGMVYGESVGALVLRKAEAP